MEHMERKAVASFPLVHVLAKMDGDSSVLVVDLVNGALWKLKQVPQVPLPLGGLFCDEPGLGKTITALSLILRTMGTIPAPPTGCKLRVLDGGVSVYRDVALGRYQSYGSVPLPPTRRERLLQIPRASKRKRTVVRPDFLARNTGMGSLPSVSNRGNVVLSRATLIVVPPVLVMHWLHQIDLHLKRGVLNVLCITDSRSMPASPYDFCGVDVVIVSLDYMGRVLKELRKEPVSLLQVHFLRLIIDEGHKLSPAGRTDFADVCKRIKAERRWLMTGTPTPVSARADIDHLHKLLQFIRDERYGIDKDAWKVEIRDPFMALKEVGLTRLKDLLDSVMIRSDKSILRSKCVIKDVVIDFSDDSAKSYNSLVRIIRRNLITSDWYDDKHAQSLLNMKNTAAAQLIAGNVRRSCCFGGSCEAMFKQEEILDTCEILFAEHRHVMKLGKWDLFKDPSLESHILDEPPVAPGDETEMRHRAEIEEGLIRADYVKTNNIPFTRLYKRSRKNQIERFYLTGKLHRIASALKNQNDVCDRCFLPTKFPFVTPCGHLLCDDCLTISKTECVAKGCGIKYRLDKDGIPEDLIELQPSLQVDKWRDDWSETVSNKVQYLIDRIVSLPHNEVWYDGEPEPHIHRPKVIVHSEYQDHLQLVAMKMKENPTLRDAYVEMFANSRERDETTRKRGRSSGYAAWAVQRFSKNPDLSVLLINTQSGSVGLDLSFVQYIFLLEPVWEPANELQIISRAHRIGCSKDIFVERLIMRGSIEQSMLSDLKRSAPSSEESSENSQGEQYLPMETVRKERQHRKVQNLLRNLKLVRTKEDLQEAEERQNAEKHRNGLSADLDSPLSTAGTPRTDIANGFAEPANVINVDTEITPNYAAPSAVPSSLKRSRENDNENDHKRKARRVRFV